MSDSLDDLRHRLKAFNAARNWQPWHTPKNLVMALTVEAGELQEIFQWLSPEESAQLSGDKLEHLKQEIGDVLNCLINVADSYGLDPVKCAQDKINLNELKYPVGNSDPQ